MEHDTFTEVKLFLKRKGIDDEGNASNFVEHEQILVCNNYVLSNLSIRGSVPVFW